MTETHPSELGQDDVVLTGIKPTGKGGVHLGNYLGAMEPTIELAKSPELNKPPLFLVADLHALNQVNEPEQLRMGVRQITAAWLACGVDAIPNAMLYKQSDIPQIAELALILTNFTPKSLMDRAHAYKALRANNEEGGKDPDRGVNMGLYTYPVLMAADILGVEATIVPVGRDQIQHIEIARGVAKRFNDVYGGSAVVLTMPRYVLQESASYIPGTDGRKMSKSYGNEVPLFATRQDWERIVRKLPTNSATMQAPGLTKYEEAVAFQIYRSLAEPTEIDHMIEALKSGRIGWKGLKDELLSIMETRFGSMRDKYFDYMDTPRKIIEVLEAGRDGVAPIVENTLKKVKVASGLD